MPSRSSRPPPKPTPPRIREQVLDYCRRVKAPILIGRLAVDLGWWANLNPIEALLEDLVRDGLLRHLTEEECRRFDVTFAYASV